jgi:hypothetical protein
VGTNSWITWHTDWGFTRAGSPTITVRAANGVTRSFSLTIIEQEPRVYAAWPHNRVPDGNIAQVTAQRGEENRYYFKIGDPNGNMQLPPVVTVTPPSTVFSTQVEGPDYLNQYRVVVTVPPNGFPGAGAASVGVRVSDDTATDSHTMTVNVQ